MPRCFQRKTGNPSQSVLLSSWWADPKGLWHSHMPDPLQAPKAELSKETGERLDKTQVIISYSLLRQNTDLQGSVAWKTKSRVKSKFFVPWRWHWLNWSFLPARLPPPSQKPHAGNKGFCWPGVPNQRGKKSASYLFSSLGLGCITIV